MYVCIYIYNVLLQMEVSINGVSPQWLVARLMEHPTRITRMDDNWGYPYDSGNQQISRTPYSATIMLLAQAMPSLSPRFSKVCRWEVPSYLVGLLKLTQAAASHVGVLRIVFGASCTSENLWNSERISALESRQQVPRARFPKESTGVETSVANEGRVCKSARHYPLRLDVDES